MVIFGDWKSPLECQPKSIINVAHNFSQRRGRDAYWANLAKVPYDVLYFRLALRDRDNVDERYMEAFRSVVDIIRNAKAFPVLCHCQMGGHRGPTAAMHVEALLSGRHRLEDVHTKLLTLSPGLLNPKRAEGRRYYPSTLDWLRKLETFE